MDLGSALTAFILIAICLMPFAIMNRNRKKRAQQLLQSLRSIATEQDCNIHQHEIGESYGIGLDETKKFVFFVKRTKDKLVEQFVDLTDIQTCKVSRTSRSVSSPDGNYNALDKLELSFIPIRNSESVVAFEFFNMDTCLQLYGELVSAEKWAKLINDQLKTHKSSTTNKQSTFVVKESYPQNISGQKWSPTRPMAR